MKRGAVLILFLFVILFSSFVYAADVAYILRNPRINNSQILGVFSEMNLSVELIKDSSINMINLNNYRMVFIGDERLRKTKNIPIYNYPSVIMNRYYGEEWGLTDADGISQLASTAPLSVRLVNNGVKQVYTVAKVGSINIDYYFLDDENKANFISIARTYTGNFYSFGDVVAFAQAGTRLINNKISGGKICFYGIEETKYWTNNARNLFKECVESVLIACNEDSDCDDNEEHTFDRCENPGTVQSRCVHEPIACLNNNECGADGFIGLPFCNGASGNDVWKYFIDFTCNNPGTIESYCSNATSAVFNQSCSFDCSGGVCIDCLEDLDCGEDSCGSFNANYCKNNDVYKNRTCHDRGCALNSCFDNLSVEEELVEECEFGCEGGECLSERIHDIAIDNIFGIKIMYNGSFIPDPVELSCNQSFAVKFKIKNIGDFNETINATGEIGLFSWQQAFFMLESGQTSSERTKTVNYDFAAGFYNVNLNAFIQGFADANPVDNFVSRQIEIICPGCISNSDCGNTSLINNYCIGNNVTSNYSVPTCLGGNCELSYQQLFNQTCAYGCSNGACLPQPECIFDSDCPADYYSNNYCLNNNLVRDFHNFSCVQQSCNETNSTEIIQSGDELVTDYTSLRLQNGLANINIQNNGYLIFKSPVHDDLMITLQKQGGGSQIIYFHDMWNVYPGICGGNDDLCIYNRTGSLIYKINLLFGNINRTRVDVLAGENLSLEIEADPLWDVGLEIWSNFSC